VAKHHDRHLAAEQLSAFLDKQLSAEEQTICETHLQSCQQCQIALLGLRQTVALLQALPQPELPRSFVLPSRVTYLQERPEKEPTPIIKQAERRRSPLSYIQRATRVVSTIAAVIGLIFLLSTVLSISHLNGGASTTSSAPYTSSNGNANSTPTPRIKGVIPHNQATSQTKTPAVASATPAIVPRPAQGQDQQPSSLTLPDINTSWGRQEIGIILLALGILGFLLSRRWRPKQRQL
jgi:Putative zinc-finger